MRLKGAIDIAAAPTAVWPLLTDPLALASCVPGVRNVRQVDERSFAGSITAAVGPMEGDFAFTSVLEHAVFPDLHVRMEGVDSVTKSRLVAVVRAAVAATDAAVGDGDTGDRTGATTLSYDAAVDVKGRLAILGEMILRATASAMIAQVTRCLRSRLEAGRTDGGGSTA